MRQPGSYNTIQANAFSDNIWLVFSVCSYLKFTDYLPGLGAPSIWNHSFIHCYHPIFPPWPNSPRSENTPFNTENTLFCMACIEPKIRINTYISSILSHIILSPLKVCRHTGGIPHLISADSADLGHEYYTLPIPYFIDLITLGPTFVKSSPWTEPFPTRPKSWPW